MKTTPNGLCSSCLNSPECVFLKNADSFVLQCEEFNPVLKTYAAEEKIKTNCFSETLSAETPPDEHMGLCRICRNQETCRYQNKPTVVLHCEEYE